MLEFLEKDLRKEFNNLLSSLQQQVNSIDNAGVCSKFLKSNNRKGTVK